jgi:hypothetical protein
LTTSWIKDRQDDAAGDLQGWRALKQTLVRV